MEVDNEADLILSRGDGQFQWQDFRQNFVCKKHYKELGRAWNSRRPFIEKRRVRVGPKCMMPVINQAMSHSNPVLANPRTYITKDYSEALLEIKKVFVPIGTGKNFLKLET